MPHNAAPSLFLLIPIVTAAQTASVFTARYGDPDAERFVVRPRITLMVRYANDRTACEMLIEPEHSIQQSDDKEQSMSTAVVSRIIEELVPESGRGVLLFNMYESMGAAELQVADYQNVTISQYFLRYLPTNHDEKSATIIRKDWLCSAGTASQKFVAGIGLNAMDLHARYGEPNMERFAARPGITVTVAYGTDQAACQIVVEPPRSIIPRVEPTKYMRPEVVTEIIDEVLPEADRGELLLSMVTQSGCNEFETIDYQNLTIYRFRHKCSLPNPEIEEAAIVKRKDLSCGNGQN